MNRGLYIHIPFCKSKCNYCDFVRTTNLSLIQRYVDSLILEIENEARKNSKFTTIYIGGGTPSALGCGELERVFFALQKNSILLNVDEFTVECNPEDVDENLIFLLKKYGVNRVSLGVQSLCNEMLRFMNRRHSASKVVEVVELLKKNLINNISVDIIYGLSKIEFYSFENDIVEFLNLDVPHISAYALSFETGSVFTRMLSENKISKLTDDEVSEQYSYLIEQMKLAGYEHYEISNFAQNGKYSKHNSSYWNGVPYVGMGAAASGYDGKVRYTNCSDINFYIESVLRSKTVREEENLTSDDIYNEKIMLGLRTSFGVSIESIKKCGAHYYEYFIKKAQPFLFDKSIYLENGVFYIDEKKWIISNYILSSLFY